jgi:hypothetical protein
MRFKVGDRIIGNINARRYGVTGQGWIGEVTKVYDNGDIEVENKERGDSFTVDSSCFDLLVPTTRAPFTPDMKILLKNSYKWVDAQYNPELDRIVDADNENYSTKDILVIENDTRNKYVKCKNCGEMILNTPEEIAKHANRSKSSEYCMLCPRADFQVGKSEITKYTKNDNGTYHIEKTEDCQIYCRANRRMYQIDDEQARAYCVFKKCTIENILPLSDTHINYPGAFDKFATIDALKDCDWEFVKQDCGFFVFKAKKRFTLKAFVNKFGIIDFFTYSYRDEAWNFNYSHRYNMLFWDYAFTSDWNITNDSVDVSKKTQILAAVAELYKGE